MLNKKDIDLIEKSGIELYHTKKFGELLGYGKCALLYNENKLENITIHFNLYNIVDKRITEQGQLFNLTCNIKSVDTKYYFDLFVKMNRLKTFSF